MRRYILVRHLGEHGFIRTHAFAGLAHYRNPRTGQTVEVPEDLSIDSGLVEAICKGLGLPIPAADPLAAGGAVGTPGTTLLKVAAVR